MPPRIFFLLALALVVLFSSPCSSLPEEKAAEARRQRDAANLRKLEQILKDQGVDLLPPEFGTVKKDQR